MTQVMEPRTAAEAVANGAQLLDEKFPGWWRHIDLDNLSIGSCWKCVCGQLETNLFVGPDYDTPYKRMRIRLGLPGGRKYGFDCDVGTFSDLDREWRNVIQTRLDLDTLTPIDERQEVLA